jgi:hypothetical protein
MAIISRTVRGQSSTRQTFSPGDPGVDPADGLICENRVPGPSTIWLAPAQGLGAFSLLKTGNRSNTAHRGQLAPSYV